MLLQVDAEGLSPRQSVDAGALAEKRIKAHRLNVHQALSIQDLRIQQESGEFRGGECQRTSLHSNVPCQLLVEPDLLAELVPQGVPAELGHGLIGEPDLEGVRGRGSEAPIGDQRVLAVFFGGRGWLFGEEERTLALHISLPTLLFL